MVWPAKNKLGSRTLRFGDKGVDVECLHDLLRLQGYDLGSEKTYGYLTKNAVRQFQRDHGLVADGIAGKRFFALALKENPPIRRRAHVVRPNETLEQIAKNYQVGVEAFSRSSHKKGVYPGQRLIFFDREIWAICENGLKTGVPAHATTGLVCSHPPVGLNHLCVVPANDQESMDVVKVHNALQTPWRRKKAAQSLLDRVPQGCGLYLDWGEVPALDGARYLKFLKQLRQNLAKPAMLWVELGPNVPRWRLWGGIDYPRVNDLVDRVVLEIPLPEQPGALFEQHVTEELVASLLRYIHSWKILLRVPVYALEWEVGDGILNTVKLGYQTALSKAYRHGARLREDEDGGLYYAYRKRRSQFHLRLPHHGSMAKVASLANRHNLAGIIIDELGMEDPRIWQTLSAHFRTASLNISEE